MVLEKRTNRSNIYDKRKEVFERCSTFEGDDIFCNIEFIKGTGLSLQLRKAAEDIVNVIKTKYINKNKNVLNIMLLFFKACIDFELWKILNEENGGLF